MQLRARVQVRLKHRDQPPTGERLPRRRERRAHFGRMVRVIIDHRDSACFAQPLEAARHARELREGMRRGAQVRLQRERRSKRRRCVADVVHPGHAQPQRNAPASRQLNLSLRPPWLEPRCGDPHVGTRPRPHAPHRHGQRRSHPLHATARIVRAGDHPPRAARELDKRGLQGGEASVALEVVGLDVVDHRHRRGQREERLVELIRLDDEQITAAQPGVSAPPCDAAADDPRGVSPGGRQRLGYHDRRGRLAVRAGNRHNRPPRNDLAEGVGPPYHRNSQRACALQLRLLLGNRSGDHDCAGAIHVPRVMSPPNPDPQGCQIGCPRRVRITPRYDHTLLLGEQRQSTHPRTANPHEVNRAGVSGCK